MRLKNQPSSEPLHISVKQLFGGRWSLVGGEDLGFRVGVHPKPMRRAARPSGRARRGAGAGFSVIKYQSLWDFLTSERARDSKKACSDLPGRFRKVNASPDDLTMPKMVKHGGGGRSSKP